MFMALNYCIKKVSAHANFQIWYRLSWSMVTDLDSKGYFKVFCCVIHGVGGKGTWGHWIVEINPNLTPWETKATFQKVFIQDPDALFQPVKCWPGSQRLVPLHVMLPCGFFKTWKLKEGDIKKKAANVLCTQKCVDLAFDSRNPGCLALSTQFPCDS